MKVYEKIGKVRPPVRPPLQDILPAMESILRTRAFHGRINVEGWNRTDVVNYWALRYVGASRIPLVEGTHSLKELGFYDLEDYIKLSVAENSLDLVMAGKPTPVMRIRIPKADTVVWAKLEWYNPFSLSIKDRTAWSLVTSAMWEGGLLQYRGLVEASSSNTGLALAALAAALGLSAKIYIPFYAPEEAEQALKILGANVVRVNASTTSLIKSSIEDDTSNRQLLMLDQFNNDANFEVHMRYTAREYYLQLKNTKTTPTVLVLASGTSGTASATAFLFKNLHPETRIYIVEPERGETIEGIRRVETGAKWLQLVSIPYQRVEVKRNEALEAICETARANGILPGPSSGAVISAITKLYDKNEITNGDTVATIFPDTLLKYGKTMREATDKCRNIGE